VVVIFTEGRCMILKINCKSFEHGGYCKNSSVKKSLFGFGARVCRLYDQAVRREDGECVYQEKHIRPIAPPPHCAKSPVKIEVREVE